MLHTPAAAQLRLAATAAGPCSCFNKPAVIQVVYHLCQQVLASKPTTLEEDTASLQQAQDLEVRDAHHILALQFRIGKKELLQSCLWQYDPQQL